MTVNYHRGTHLPKAQGGTDPMDYVVIKIKLTGDGPDDDPVAVNTRAFTFQIDNDTHGLWLTEAYVSVGTVSSSGAVEIEVRNETNADTVIMAADGPGASVFGKDCSASIPARPDNLVQDEDLIVIEITSAGTGAKGLGCTLKFL